MTRPRILITRILPDAVMARADRLGDVTALSGGEKLTAAQAADALGDYDGILAWHGDAFTAAAFDGGPHRCRVVANFGAGYDHIDAEAARAAGVAVSNTPGAVSDATADIAMLLTLMTLRRAGEGERILRRGDWRGWGPTEMLGQHATGKTIGIIGMGGIGKAVAKRAHFGFGMDVVFYNRSRIAEFGVPSRQLGSLGEVLAAADIVVVALASNPQTRHFVGAGELKAMKPSAHLVNISRGEIVDEQALISALKDGVIAGAGLDVYEFEPDVPADLIAMENVALLPHLGTAALEVRESMGFMALDNLAAGLEGRPLPNAV